MFNCDKCGETTQPNEPMHKRVVEQRHVEYRVDGEVVGHGFEIVREDKLCPRCAKPADRVTLTETNDASN